MFHVDICQKKAFFSRYAIFSAWKTPSIVLLTCCIMFSRSVGGVSSHIILAPSHNFWIPSLTITFLLYHPQTERYARNVYSRYFSEMCVYLLCDAGKR